METLFWKKHDSKIITGFLILAALVAGWLLYQRYLRPQYQLIQLLPKDHQISFEYRSDRFSLPGLQQQKMLSNQALLEIYSATEKDINSELAKFNFEAREILERSEHKIFFYQSPEKYGLIIAIPNRKTFKKINEVSFEGFHKQIVKEQILALSNDQELLNQMAGQKITADSIPYLSLTIDPWLTVKFRSSFLKARYQNGILSDLQRILQPLEFTGSNDYYLEIDSDSLSVNLSLKPASPASADSQSDLRPYLDFLPQKPDLVFGLSDLESLKKQLGSSQNLQSLWQKFDSQLWIANQVSLANLLRQAKPPVIISLKGNDWQILTSSDNRDLAEYYLKSYLAQLSPKESLKILPDGTPITELVADFSKIQWQEGLIGDWQSFSSQKLGFALKDGLMLVGNNILEPSLGRFEPACSFGSKQQPKNPIETIISINSGLSWLNTSNFLKNFSNISLISYPNGEINACLGI